MASKRVLLTGGAGSIGIHVIGHIMHNTDWEVVSIDSFRHKGYRDRLVQTLKDHPDWATRIIDIQHDLVCPISPEMSKLIGNVNYILHLAALSDVFFSVQNPAYVIKNNIESTLTMLEYAKHIEHEAFVYFSTDEVYGATTKTGAHKEWDTHRPSNAYAASKAASEDICHSYWRGGGIKLILTNTMNNFSEFQSDSKYPVIIQKALIKDEEIEVHGNEKEIGTRYYIHSRNAADALLFILNSLPPKLHEMGKIDEPDRYHIVGDEQLSNLEIAERIAKLMSKKLKYKLKDFHKDNAAHDIHYGLQDNKLQKAGWKQPQSFDESMKNTIDWQMKHPEWIGLSTYDTMGTEAHKDRHRHHLIKYSGCSLDGCEREHRAGGMCVYHYNKQLLERRKLSASTDNN